MSDSIPPPLSGKRRGSKLLFASVIVVVFGVVAILAAFGVARWNWHREVKEQINATKRAGLPATAAELDAWYAPVTASSNAALFYEALFRKMSTNRLRGTFPSPRRDERLTEAVSNQFRAIVVTNVIALEMARRGTSMTQARYSINLSNGVNAELPHLTKLKTLSQYLRAEALLYTTEDKPSNAVESILAIHRAARTLDDEPVLMSPLVALAMDANAFLSLERSLNHSALTERQLTQLSDAAKGRRSDE
jgi:hypothetical protein